MHANGTEAVNHTLRLLLALALAALAVPTSALAGTSSASVDGTGKLTYVASGSDANRVEATSTGSTVQLTDTGSGVTVAAGSGCSGGGSTVTCTGVATLALSLSGGDNVADTTGAALPTTIGGGTGADRFSSGSANDTLSGGDGDDWLDGGLGSDITYGGGGSTDVAIYWSHSAAVTLTLDGAQNDGSPGENDWIIGDVESLAGGSGNDTLTGNSGFNYLSGGRGDDTINGGGGGGDFLSYWERSAPVTVNFATDTFGDQALGESDSVDPAIVNALGGTGGDRLIGDDGANILWGGWSGTTQDGDDWLQGRGGTDTFWGGEGNDTVDYSDKSSSVNVSIDDNNNDADGDNVASDVENINGTTGNDTLTGDADGNVLDGGLGSDVLNGGSGSDTASYARHTLAVTASVGAGTDGQAGESDTLGSIENLTGGAGADTLTGDGNPNTLDGGAGPDLLDGGAGDDVFRARDGALDGLTCGLGVDTGSADIDDTIASDCESIERPAVTPPPDEPPTSPPADPATDTPAPPADPVDPAEPSDTTKKDGLSGPVNLEPPIVPAQTAPVTASGVALVDVVCPEDAGSCKGTVDLLIYKGSAGGKKRGKIVAARRRTIRVGRARFKAEAGTKPIVRVQLNRRGRRRVLRGRGKRCRMKVTTRTRTAAGKVITTSRDITLRARRGAGGNGGRKRR